jgi:type IV secretory pathway VirB3-like protein
MLIPMFYWSTEEPMAEPSNIYLAAVMAAIIASVSMPTLKLKAVAESFVILKVTAMMLPVAIGPIFLIIRYVELELSYS